MSDYKIIVLIDIILRDEPRFINLRDKKGRTALHYATFKSYDEEVQCLLKKFSASPIEWDKDGLFPIHLAAIEGHTQAVQVLLQHCPDPRKMLNRNGQSILHVATIAEKYDIVSYILKNDALGLLINHRDLDENTRLHLAAIKKDAMIICTMAQDMRVNFKIVNNEGLTVLNVIKNFIERTGFNQKMPAQAGSFPAPALRGSPTGFSIQLLKGHFSRTTISITDTRAERPKSAPIDIDKSTVLVRAHHLTINVWMLHCIAT
ncbi:hypothetical protein Nepgr_000426 [Nepenthes gracilis]|uniref:Uncharacterized protein n=1 Tax=Nepenthes gracilis TaxID=150966 RepID=A0AAD3P3T9_NEPGR|nr:hypothetical protein Nepgr_000426 [Nepenthes gracilis]